MLRTIRQGLFAALAGFTVLICICYTALAVVIAYVTEDMVVDRLLEREAVAAAAHFREHGRIGPVTSKLFGIYRSFDDLPAVVRQDVKPAARRAEVFTRTGQHFHLRAFDAGSQRLYLLADAGPLLVVSQVVQDVGGVLIFVALGLIGMALLLAYVLARRLVLPLQVLAREARELTLASPVAFSGRGRPDEIGVLAERLAASFGQLQDALKREHAFTRDVSHELRTPLTVMNNTLALSGSGQPDVAQLQSSLDEVRHTIDVLFALARAEHVESARFDLRMCIEQSLLTLLRDGERDLAVDLPDRIEVHGNPRLATLLLNNCLGNALFHGGPGAQLRVAYAGGRLSICNTVVAAARVQGFAHGQNLQVRMAQAMRWEVSFHPGDDGYRVDIVPTI